MAIRAKKTEVAKPVPPTKAVEKVEKPFPVKLKRNYFTENEKHLKGTTIVIPIHEARDLVQQEVAEVDFEEVVKRFYD
ncbi:hypothetical protein [Phyllobacterium sp. SB3]|uniref:hypothetical protein n=1 Tax=Phyllobacterium sp. SB3 TaxID=3156073 RepID=UPI0032AFA238